MKIVKVVNRYVLGADGINVFFESFTKDSNSVNLWIGQEIVGILYFERTSEFYRAWRECHNGL